MFVAFTFEAKPGHEAEFERLLNSPEGARKVAAYMGATRNLLFMKDGRMIRVLEFPEGHKPGSLAEIAKTDKDLENFLRKLGPIIKDGFDYDRPETLDAFNKRITIPMVFEVHP